MYDIFLLVKSGDNYIDLVDEYPNIKIIFTEDRLLSENVFTEILNKTLTKYFYVINKSDVKFINFDFDFVPESENNYVYRWNGNNHLRLFNKKEVLKNASKYTDSSTLCPYKEVTDIALEYTEKRNLIDVFVVASDERDALHLVEQYPNVKIIKKDNNKIGFKTLWDILKTVTTDFFYVVTDPQINTIDFDFSFYPDTWDKEYMHIWNNDLTIRLFSTDAVSDNTIRYTEQSIERGKTKIKNYNSVDFV